MSWEIRSEDSYGKFFLGVKFSLCHPLKNLFSETVFFFVGGDITRLNNKSRWLKRSVVIHFKRVELCLLYPPPCQVQSKNKLKIALAVLAAFSSNCVLAEDFIYHGTDEGNPEINRVLQVNASSGDREYDNIDISLNPPIAWDRYTVTVSDGKTLKVLEETSIVLEAEKTTDDVNAGTNALYAEGSESKIHLMGNVNILIYHNVESENIEKTVGANNVYAKTDAEIYIGSSDSKTTIWSIAAKPDAISAKIGGKVILNSTQNQIIGSIDMLSQDGLGTTNSLVRGTFSGESSFWFGDDQSTMNATIEVPVFGTYTGKEQIEELYARLNSLKDVPIFGSFAQEIWSKLNLRGTQITDELDLTFENGAQWTYFGISDVTEYSGATLTPTPKRISAITLKDRGIINLFDANIQDTWKQLGLTDLWPDLEDVNHDYVRIGDLRGSDGIFRLDLNSDNHKASDMIFVESSSEAGTHHIEPYRPQDLTSISEGNRLIFALTTADANGVTFDETENIYGETLYDYELGISHETIDETKAEQIAEIESMVSNYDTFTDFDIADFYGGTNWFINRLTITKSAASLAMGSAGFAAYDAAIEMDRRDRRLLQTFKDEETGLWVRARHGERGVKNEYGYQLNGFAVGTDYAFSDTNVLGIAFSFEKGDTDFKSVVGDGNMKRYELAIYNTHDFGAPYLDFVGRLGIVKSDYTAYNQSRTLSTSGDFDQKYATLSAEAGYTLEDTNGVFIEPQVQVQLTYLKDYDYASDRNMHVSADSDYVVLSRVGLRGGRHFDSESLQGEVYGRADVYHQFTDGQDAIFRDTEQAMFQTWGTNKTFASIGLGSYLKAKSGWGVQFDVEKNLGGKSIDSWMITGQARYEF